MKKLIAVLMCGAIGFGTPGLGFAQSSSAEKVEQLSKDATAKYREGDFNAAIELFQKAYDIEPVPNLLFNIARCHEKLEEWDKAIGFYQKFVVEPDVEKDARQAAVDRIDALNEVKQALAAQDRDTTTPDDGGDKQVEAPPAEVSNSPDNTWSYIMLGSGAGLIGGGVLFGVLASSKQSDFEQSTDVGEKQDLRSSGQTFAMVADGLYITGAVVGLIGVYMLLTADEPEQNATFVRPNAWIESTGGGFVLEGSF
ncbi:tetratricopeptide repeat protein [Microvenator marinus]|jgi:tetratricopeptide (TPR) repeat protein|uniref:Tetratricopeptide repeat protein n=1 Tax=Microvenator marinus TaxID=2600177 RepID=A0A5B8XNV4_9DELT|nr:tetratricopeptide repeat protein [Microvenator marinus]QED25703.1 tetratricopeptide repeat protein [Microvenator marinus]